MSAGTEQRRSSTRWLHAAMAVTGLTAVACSGTSEDAIAVARNEVFTIDQVVDLLADQPGLPADESVVRALAGLWVDYTLLGVAAEQDPELESLDLSAVVAPRADQEMIRALRMAAVDVDTVLADDELRFLFDRDQPGALVKARHILLGFDVTREASRDSAVALASELRGRILSGESFADVAREYSRDPATASAGGDLGDPFPRERMVAPFSEAAFALDPGEISEPVETQFGIHLIRVDRKEMSDFDEVKAAYRNTIKNRRVEVAESAYVAALEEPATPEVTDGAIEIVRALAEAPDQKLTRRARDAVLVDYVGGTYTAGEFMDYVRNQSPAYRSQVGLAPVGQLEQMLNGLVRAELLVARAVDEGLALTDERMDTLMAEARAQFRGAVEDLGITSDSVPVIELLGDMLLGRRDVIPLGAVSYVLRDTYDGRIVDVGVERAVERIAEARATVAPPVLAPPEVAIPDSVTAPGDTPDSDNPS